MAGACKNHVNVMLYVQNGWNMLRQAGAQLWRVSPPQVLLDRQPRAQQTTTCTITNTSSSSFFLHHPIIVYTIVITQHPQHHRSLILSVSQSPHVSHMLFPHCSIHPSSYNLTPPLNIPPSVFTSTNPCCVLLSQRRSPTLVNDFGLASPFCFALSALAGVGE